MPAAGRAQAVQGMFSRIAGRYDLLNTLLSLGQDRSWRREAAQVALEGGGREVLDAATGTGELALAMKRLDPGVRVIGVDFSAPMLELARRKAAESGLELELQQGDVTALPFPDGSFDAVTIAYGLRNLESIEAGLSEFRRLLKPSGRLVILEFPPPPDGPLGSLFRLYFERVLPFIGGLISGSPEAYNYLPESVLAFPPPRELVGRMQRAGFERLRYRLQSGGISAIYVGVKSE